MLFPVFAQIPGSGDAEQPLRIQVCLLFWGAVLLSCEMVEVGRVSRIKKKFWLLCVALAAWLLLGEDSFLLVWLQAGLGTVTCSDLVGSYGIGSKGSCICTIGPVLGMANLLGGCEGFFVFPAF